MRLAGMRRVELISGGPVGSADPRMGQTHVAFVAGRRTTATAAPTAASTS
ncbi:hypothetical protein [Pseudofrankia asymbiotica]|nr:hypothetical protein [Pseudofrankia asymbiotica]